MGDKAANVRRVLYDEQSADVSVQDAACGELACRCST